MARQAMAVPACIPQLGELKALAGNADVDSRIVIGPDSQGLWAVHHGPFELAEFDDLPDSNWTLLIQDLDKWCPPLAKSWTSFSFIPQWRRDDIMISYAAPGGSVGPHVDRYDVFLVQCLGERVWTTGTPGKALDPQLTDELKLCGIEQPVSHPPTRPGDVLYIPPGHAHHGVAVTECMTLSYGLRAPTLTETVLEFAQEQAEAGPDMMYSDKDLDLTESGPWLHELAVERLRKMLRAGLDPESPQFSGWVARLLTTYSARRTPPAPPAGIDRQAIMRELQRGRPAKWSPWSQRLGVKGAPDNLLVVDGVAYPASHLTISRLLDSQDFVWNSDMGLESLELIGGLFQSGQMVWSDHE